MVATVHGWCGYVEKSSDTVFSQMVLNKMWIPDDMINVIKDFLYISAAEVLRKFYRLHLNRSISDLTTDRYMMVDIYGRERLVFWQTGFVYTVGDLQIQGHVCVTCGNPSHLHNNLNGCCALMWDLADEPIEMEILDQEVQDETIAEINAEADAEEEGIPEVSWAIDIPTANQEVFQNDIQQISVEFQQSAAEFQQASDEYRQVVLNNWNRAVQEGFQQDILDTLHRPVVHDYDYDIESQMADYAEYQREIEMEEYLGRRGR